MYARFILAIALSAGLFAAGLGLANLPMTAPASPSHAVVIDPASAWPVLPTVHVHADATHTLPEIIVHPSASEKRAATALAPAAAADSVALVARNERLPALNPVGASTHAGLDMPYYSFGKALPRLSKE